MGWNPLTNILQKAEQKGPPDLEDLFKKFFGKKKKADNPFNYSKNSNQPPSGNNNNSSNPTLSSGNFGMLSLGIVVIIIIIWALSGIFTVKPYEEGVILRFGKYNRTVGEGPHWMARFFEKKYVVNIQQQNNFPWPIQPMLTEPTKSKKSGSKQSQLVDVSFNIQWKISNLKDFLFNVDFPQTSLKESIDSAIRQVIGQTSFNEIITTDRDKVQTKVKNELIYLMKKYKTGIEIMSVNMQQAIAPEPVRGAFQDLVNAPQDQETTINKSEIYQNRILPIANGQAKRIVIESEAKKQNLILTAKANTAQYKAVLSKYKISPVVTGDRLYFDALQKVFTHSNIMLVDSGKGNNNVFYLPLTPGQVNANSSPNNSYNQNSDSNYGNLSTVNNNKQNINSSQSNKDFNRMEVAGS